MVKRDFLSAAKILANRNKRRLDENISPKEQEVEDLFYWLLSLLGNTSRTLLPASKEYFVSVTELYPYEDEHFPTLTYRSFELTDSYRACYVRREDFFDVIEEVTTIFNEISEYNKGNFKYWALHTGSSLTVYVSID